MTLGTEQRNVVLVIEFPRSTMIVSHQHKFIFLKTKKTAGTSVEIALSQLCGPDDIITPLNADEALRANGRGAQNWRLPGCRKFPQLLKRTKVKAKDFGFYNHAKAAEVRAHIGEKVWQSYFKFAFERNPWDRQVSLYFHRNKDIAEPTSFADFIHAGRRAKINNFDVYTISGEVVVDVLGRFETLEEDLKRALDQIGLTLPSKMPRAKTDARRDPRSYREYYDANTREIVASWYAPEIALLGYKF